MRVEWIGGNGSRRVLVGEIGAVVVLWSWQKLPSLAGGWGLWTARLNRTKATGRVPENRQFLRKNWIFVAGNFIVPG